MDKSEIISKITQKSEFSQLPEKDVELAFSKFERRQTSDEEKIKLTRDLLRKTFSVFASNKTFSLNHLNKRDEEWILKKHLSTKERFPFYEEVYTKIFQGINEKEISIIDLGAGINGLSFNFFPKEKKIKYLAVEGVGQLDALMNSYFSIKKINSASAIKMSLFDLSELSNLIQKQKKPRIIFLFKVIDSLEMLDRDYSKKLLKEIVPFCTRLVLSFATRSLVSRKKFFVSRKWILDFINENFNLVDDFELGGERYLIIENKYK
ncbi:Ribosomal RNA methyltransferase (FmrO) [uncultured archaeon]|nr:Ribosomal RNA methyltransferase (FmrO) [uncultured archaeon]